MYERVFLHFPVPEKYQCETILFKILLNAFNNLRLNLSISNYKSSKIAVHNWTLVLFVSAVSWNSATELWRPTQSHSPEPITPIQ